MHQPTNHPPSQQPGNRVVEGKRSQQLKRRGEEKEAESGSGLENREFEFEYRAVAEAVPGATRLSVVTSCHEVEFRGIHRELEVEAKA